MYFATRKGLKPGDVVITPKSIAHIVRHYVIYMGIYNGDHWYIENNYLAGVRWINDAFFIQDNPKYFDIRKFEGNETERYWALERAKSKVGTPYDLVRFNCEHLANYSQYGQQSSKQVNNGLGAAALVAGVFAFVGLVSASDK